VFGIVAEAVDLAVDLDSQFQWRAVKIEDVGGRRGAVGESSGGPVGGRGCGPGSRLPGASSNAGDSSRVSG
jgi:hypothetical protein